MKPSTFFEWVLDDVEGLADAYARARKIRALAMQDEVLEILDDARNDYVEKHTRSGTFVQLNSENIKRSQLRAEYRERLAKQNLPKSLGGEADSKLSGTFIVQLDEADQEL